MASELTCPKCQAPMRTYERNGIHIDQCTECRGIFLDRGELELLLDAESAYTRARDPGRSAPVYPVVPGLTPSANQPSGYGQDRSGHHGESEYGGHKGKRKKGFLGELFD